MSVLDLDALLRAATSAALAGGELVLASFQSPVNVREKSPGDWVTDTDMQSERMVRRVLEELAPGIPVHGEEEGGEGETVRRRRAYLLEKQGKRQITRWGLKRTSAP